MPVKVYKTKWFVRFARKERVIDESLDEAIDRAEQGLIDADPGGGLIKQRVAQGGQGRSGGHRMLVAYCAQGRAVFLYGFAKSEQENIGPDEPMSLREIAAAWLSASAEQIGGAIKVEELQEIVDDKAGA